MPYSTVLKIKKGDKVYTLPTPDEGGVKIGKQKIWSENTRRNAKCTMVGDIKAVKTTLSITWSKLTQSQLNLLDEAINDPDAPFFNIIYVDVTNTGDEKTTTKKFYSDSSIEYTRKKYRKNKNGSYTDIYYTDVTVNFIEK